MASKLLLSSGVPIANTLFVCYLASNKNIKYDFEGNIYRDNVNIINDISKRTLLEKSVSNVTKNNIINVIPVLGLYNLFYTIPAIVGYHTYEFELKHKDYIEIDFYEKNNFIEKFGNQIKDEILKKIKNEK